MRWLSVLALLGIGAAARQVWDWTSTFPGPRTTSPSDPSACGNGGWGAAYAYACPHLAVLTSDMLAAARYDGNGPGDFVYATAGGGSDADCGTCYQVQLLDAERQWRPDFPLLVVQVTNSGFDVMPGQLDLFMGAGGFGFFTACNSDCGSRFCQGGGCREAMYEGPFDAWVNPHFPDPNACYSGGVKWLNETGEDLLWGYCRSLSGGGNQSKDQMLWDSCFQTNRLLLHQNFVATRYERVRCPRGLYLATGLRRLDDAAFPAPGKALPLTRSCQGSREGGHYCVTTMQDCCVPSCAWPGKAPADPDFPRVDRCSRQGLPL